MQPAKVALLILIANLRIQIETFFHIKLELDNYLTFFAMLGQRTNLNSTSVLPIIENV